MEWKPGIVRVKDPDACLDYVFDWAALTNGRGRSDWLQVGETIVSAVVTVSTGLVKDSDEIKDANTSVAVWLSGGAAQTEYTVACRVTTSMGRRDERTINVYVSER